MKHHSSTTREYQFFFLLCWRAVFLTNLEVRNFQIVSFPKERINRVIKNCIVCVLPPANAEQRTQNFGGNSDAELEILYVYNYTYVHTSICLFRSCSITCIYNLFCIHPYSSSKDSRLKKNYTCWLRFCAIGSLASPLGKG